MKKYWYLYTFEECPLCGRASSYKERQFTPKPEDPNLRYKFVDRYDYCDV